MLNFLKTTQHNSVAATQLLLKELNVKVSATTVKNSLQRHPEFPSLLTISDCLKEWHVPNQAYEIDKGNFNPENLEFPFIAYSRARGGMFVLVHSINDKQVVLSDENKRNIKITEQDFLNGWSGVALHAIKNEKSGEKGYMSKHIAATFSRFKIPILIVTILTTILVSLDYQALTWGSSLLTLIKFAGIVTSLLLLMHSIDHNNPFIQNLCSVGNKNGCNAILKSEASKVTSWLSWSEVGLFYFMGSFLALLIAPNSLSLLVWMNILAMPYTVYSIAYQYKNQNWCVLCCTVQVLLGLELITNLSLNYNSFNLYTAAFTLSTFTLFSISFLIPMLSWAFLKPFFLKSGQYKPLRQQLNKFKYNSELFNQVLAKQPRYAVPDELTPIILGNPNATTTITIVSDPFCAPCALAHEELNRWLAVTDEIKLKIIFRTADEEDDENTKMSRHASALSLLNDAELLERALNDWYKQSSKKYESWAAKYPISFNGEMKTVTQKQKAWCELTEITSTPTILLNGYKIPEPYQLGDIKYLLP